MTHRLEGPGPGGLARVDGKFLAVNGRRFLIKGVAYGTFAPTQGGVQFPDPSRVAQDFGLMAANGINTVRTYTVPPDSLLDEAARHGLRVMVGIPWAQHVAFLDDRQLVRHVRSTTAETVRRMAAHPAVLLFAVGNEIPPAVVRWHGQGRVERFLRELYEDAKSASPESLLTYVNFPPTEYLDVDCFDVAAFNVYLHHEADLRAYLARLQNVAGLKPLLLAEAGADSVREGLDGQARITAMHLRAAFAEGACGAVAFSWTDEWWRGGHDVDDWAFGLVDRDRRPKPAAAAVRQAFAEAPFSAAERATWPKVSVVVCAYNAADTIDDCLRSLAALTYPAFDVIVVNDGSQDSTSTIARRHEGVHVVDVPNGGLAAARNVGLAHATAEIVAYTDADVRVDPDWLTYLVQPLLTQAVVGSGGPNVVPEEDPLMAQCVARAPGGPVHVLLDDRTAEHVPGCNMAFRREALIEIGGFNPLFVRAGDDVDICWRLQAKGLRIGFAPSALVWHHHRSSIRAYWRQQVGYGEGETWLVGHHPEKFAGSDMLWHGRIYSPLPFIRSFTRSRVNTGVWGTAAFPSVYSTKARFLDFFPHSPAWLAMSTALLVAGGLGLLTPSRLEAWLLLGMGAIGWATTINRCVWFASRSDVRGLPRIGQLSATRSRLVARAIIAWLHLIQPVARMRGRLRGLWPHQQAARPERTTPRLEGAPVPSFENLRRAASLILGGTVEHAFWSESWVSHSTWLTSFVDALRTLRPTLVLDVDDGWRTDRDVSLAAGRWAWLHARVLVEEHAEGRSLVRVGARLGPSTLGAVQSLALAGLLVMAASAAIALDWPALSLASTLAALGIAVRALWDVARSVAVFERATGRVVDAGHLAPLARPSATAARRTALATRAGSVQMATVAMLVATAGLGVWSLTREAIARRATALAPESVVDLRYESGGGVAVGLSGDLYVAEGGFIERLRPRPPIDAALTADEIGSDVYPLLGSPVAFEAAADIAVGPNGNLYVADARGNRVCRIERVTGSIVTIAGTGRAGFGGDGGVATGADLRGPGAIAIGPKGDVYIADTLNHRVRVVSRATGRIRTLAGDGATAETGSVGDNQPAIRGHLNRPSGVAVAPNGDVYIADTGHNRVRKVDAITGIITTVAGDGSEGALGDGGPATSASLAGPMGLALVTGERGLTIYVADWLNDRVRAIGPDGQISTLSGPEPMVAPVRIAYHPGGWLYVKDGSPDGVTAVAASAALNAAIGPPPRVSRRTM